MDLLRGRLSIVFKSLSFQDERFVYNKYEDSRCAKRSKYIFYLHLFSLLFYFFYRLEDKISKSMSVCDEIDNELGAKKYYKFVVQILVSKMFWLLTTLEVVQKKVEYDLQILTYSNFYTLNN